MLTTMTECVKIALCDLGFRCFHKILDLAWSLVLSPGLESKLRQALLSWLIINVVKCRNDIFTPKPVVLRLAAWFQPDLCNRSYRGKPFWLISTLNTCFSLIKVYIFLIRTTSWTWKCNPFANWLKIDENCRFPHIAFFGRPFWIEVINESGWFAIPKPI